MDTHRRRGPTLASVIMIAAMFGVVCAMVSSAIAPTTYRATATAFVGESGVTDLVHREGEEETRAQVVRSYASIATAPIVLAKVVDRLRLPLTEADLASRVDVEVPADTSIVEVEVSDPNAGTAARIANAIVQQLAAASDGLQPQTADAPAPAFVTPVRRAVAPASPSGLALPLVVLLGLVSGGGIAALALLITWLVQRRPPSGGGLLAPSML